MLTELYTLYYRVVFHVDFIKYVSVNNCLKRQILSNSQNVNWPWCFVYCYVLPVFNVPCTNCWVVWRTNQHIFLWNYDQAGNPFGVAIQLPDNLATILKDPLNNCTIFVGSKQVFFGKHSTYDLLSNGPFFSLLFFFPCLHLHLLLFFFFLPLDCSIQQQFKSNFSFGEIPSPHWSISGDTVEHVALLTKGGV